MNFLCHASPKAPSQIRTRFGFIIFVWDTLHLIYSKVIFPSLFKELDVDSFIVCELAKHRHASFSISNKKTFVPFSLIYSGDRGLSKVPNILGLDGNEAIVSPNLILVCLLPNHPLLVPCH